MKDMFYFTKDGAYGAFEDGSILTPTSDFTNAQWQEIYNCLDSERVGIVQKFCEDRIKGLKGII
jgi:hypothetical protein